MSNKFRGITWNNARFGPKIQVRRSIDLAELGDFGSIAENSQDLPTRGSAHRADRGGSTSATRGHTDLRGIAGQHSNVVDTQDMGLISDATTTHRIWSSTGAITDVVTSAPTTLYNPSGSSSSDSSTSTSVDFSSTSLEHTLTTPSITQNALYGYSAAVNDTYVVGGAPAGTTSSNSKVYVHNLSDGSLKYTLNNPNAYGTSAGDRFGGTVDMSDSYVLVVAVYEDENSTTLNTGQAYLYDLSDGTLKYTLPRGSANVNEYYGYFHNSTALNDDYAVIGARGAGNGGKVLIYDLSNNTLTQTLTSPVSGGDFGETVALTDSYVIVGDPSEKKTYVYNISDFSLEYTFSNPNSETSSTSDKFGQAVAASGSTLVVGAPNEDYGYSASGTVYVYDLTDGTLSRTIHNPDTDNTNVSGNYFGSKLALDGDNLVAGMNSPTTDGGRTFIIDITDGSLVKTIDNPVTNAGNTMFASDVGIKGDHIVIGSSEQSAGSTNVTKAGKVYVYKA